MGKKGEGKNQSDHPDTYIQVPGTVVPAAAATISDRRIRSGPLPRIVILLLHPLQANGQFFRILRVFGASEGTRY